MVALQDGARPEVPPEGAPLPGGPAPPAAVADYVRLMRECWDGCVCGCACVRVVGRVQSEQRAPGARRAPAGRAAE